MIYNYFFYLALVASFGTGVYFADVVKRYLKKGLNFLLGRVENTPKNDK